jgi:hypothetical protein
MKNILIRCGIGVLSIGLAFVLWWSLLFALAKSGILILLQVAAFFSHWFIFGWLFFAALSVFIYYVIASRFLNRQASHQ